MLIYASNSRAVEDEPRARMCRPSA